MKMMKQLCTLLLTVVFATSLSAQHMNKEVGDETKVQKYTVETAKGTMEYTVKVNTQWSDYVETVNNQKKERPRVSNANNVVSTIEVNNDADMAYDNVITLSYQSKKEEPVTVVPTPQGFDIMVAGEKLRYNYIKQECYAPKGCPIDIKLQSDAM